MNTLRAFEARLQREMHSYPWLTATLFVAMLVNFIAHFDNYSQVLGLLLLVLYGYPAIYWTWHAFDRSPCAHLTNQQ